MDIVFHYPPELFNLLVDTIPKLCRSKKDVLIFFKGAGINDTYLGDIERQIKISSNSISKYEIVRTLLTRLNQKGEGTLRERREVLKRVVEIESYDCCWENDKLAAKGLVAEVRQLINVKDSFTRMNLAREQEAEEHRKKRIIEIAKIQERKVQFARIKDKLFSLFGNLNPQHRGKALEEVLNELFKASDILVKEAFVISGANGEGIVEQIDGAIELDGEYYLVEMKWYKEAIGVDIVAPHLVRVFSRGQARGIIISANGFTEPAITQCREALSKMTIVLCELRELVLLLDGEVDIKSWLRKKVQTAIIEKEPLAKFNYT